MLIWQNITNSWCYFCQLSS